MTEGTLTKELEQVGVQTYLKISSKGEIEPESFRLIGASTKRDDDESIGIFGSGLKYSIAYLLRNKINFWVFSGTREVKFETKTANFRGKQFEQIYIDGEATSFTTDLGYDWELWWSIREIYCNAIDEGEYSCEEVASFESTEGETVFYIEVNKDVKEILDNWGRYFAEGRKDLIYSKGGAKLYKGGEDLIVYRKGVRCYYNPNIKAIFHYDFEDIEINESRTIKDTFDMNLGVSKILALIESLEVLEYLLKRLHMTKEVFEFHLLWGTFAAHLSDGCWEEFIKPDTVVEYESAGNYTSEIEKKNPWVLPSDMCEKLMDKLDIHHVAYGQKGVQEVEEPTEYEQAVLNKALEFLNECEHPIEYPITIVDFKEPETKGACGDENIYVGRSALNSVHLTVKVLIEENEHLKTGYSDCTRAFQNHFLELFIKEKTKRFAYPI